MKGLNQLLVPVALLIAMASQSQETPSLQLQCQAKCTNMCNSTAIKLPVESPMEAFVNVKEGIALRLPDKNGGQKKYMTLMGEYLVPRAGGYGYGYVALEWNGKSFDHKTEWTRNIVGQAISKDIYPLEFGVGVRGLKYGVNGIVNMRILKNSDDTISLECQDNGKYLRSEQITGIYNQYGKGSICLSSSICTACKFELVVGSVIDLTASILSITWGTPEQPLSSSPDVLVEAVDINYSDTETELTLTATKKITKRETTIWEHAWGLDLMVQTEAEAKIPLFGGGKLTLSAKASYNGKYGTQDTKETSDTIQETRKVKCPPRTRCRLKVVATMLDNFQIPFTALVERTQEATAEPLRSVQRGTWSGVMALNIQSIYCTDDLVTNTSNCPTF